MYWENLSADEFEKIVKEVNKTCVIPVGCYEKHGNHLPLGTDMIIARAIVKEASKIESCLVYPDYFYTQVSEVKHQSGTIAIKTKLQMELLTEVCDEIARNGIEKIILVNCHGGNQHFLNYFCQTQLDSKKDYLVYVYHIWPLPKDQREELISKYGEIKILGHGDTDETSLIMAIDESLVNLDLVKSEECQSLNRFSKMRFQGLYTGIHWYANFPHHQAGDPLKSSKDYGKDILNMQANNVANAIKMVKEDQDIRVLQDEFYSNTVKGKN